MYNFKRLIKKYGKFNPSKRVETDGGYDYEQGGIWVEGAVTWVEFEGAVTPIDEKLINDNLGYTTNDKKLHTYEPLESGQIVKHKDIEYTLMNYKDYKDFDENLSIFIMKRGGKDV